MSSESHNEQFRPSIDKEAQTNQSYEAKFIHSVLDASLDGIFVCEAIRDPKGKIIDLLIKRINPAFTRIRKIEEWDVVGKRYLSLFPSARDVGMFDLYCQVIETGTPAHEEFHYKGAELEAWYEISAAPLDRDHLVVTFHDFTAVKKLQLQLEQKVMELEILNRNLENFVFASSHDLKEPLRKALVFLDRIKTDYAALLDTRGRSYLSRMEASVDRMRKLVDDLLVYSELSLEPKGDQVVDLNRVVNEVVTDLELHFLEKKATIRREPLPAVNGSYRQFHQLFQSLIENSLKFSLKDKPVEIRLSAREIWGKEASITLPSEQRENRFYEITLQDNGVGFDPQYADRIFTVFQRLHSDFSGTGLGLFIAQKVVQNHNGWIGASSKEGVGTSVTFVLPFPQVSA